MPPCLSTPPIVQALFGSQISHAALSKKTSTDQGSRELAMGGRGVLLIIRVCSVLLCSPKIRVLRAGIITAVAFRGPPTACRRAASRGTTAASVGATATSGGATSWGAAAAAVVSEVAASETLGPRLGHALVDQDLSVCLFLFCSQVSLFVAHCRASQRTSDIQG